PASRPGARAECWRYRGKPRRPLQSAPPPTKAKGFADAGALPHSSLREKLGDLLGGNGTFPHDAPTRLFVGEVDDGGSHFTGRSSAIDNDRNAVLQLIADGQRSGALGFTAQVGGGGGDGNLRCLHHRQRNRG